jgi:hypothetical protein
MICKDTPGAFAQSLIPAGIRSKLGGVEDEFINSYSFLLAEQRRSLQDPKQTITRGRALKVMARVFANQLKNENPAKFKRQIYIRSQAIRKKLALTDCNFTDEEIFAIFMYTTKLYRPINSILRENDAERVKKMKAFTSAIESGLDKIADYKGPVLRGANLPAAVYKEYCLDCVVSDLAFTSTSIDKQFLGSHWLNLHSLSGKFIGPLSSSPSVNEVIFKPNTRFKIKKKLNSRDLKGRPIEKIDLVEISD